MTTAPTIDRALIRGQRKALQRVIDAYQEEISNLRQQAFHLTQSLEELQEQCPHSEDQWYVEPTTFIQCKRCADCHKYLGV